MLVEKKEDRELRKITKYCNLIITAVIMVKYTTMQITTITEKKAL